MHKFKGDNNIYLQPRCIYPRNAASYYKRMPCMCGSSAVQGPTWIVVVMIKLPFILLLMYLYLVCLVTLFFGVDLTNIFLAVIHDRLCTTDSEGL